MENQVKANTIRIQLLEQQNAKLRNSISKMLNVQRVDDPAVSDLYNAYIIHTISNFLALSGNVIKLNL